MTLLALDVDYQDAQDLARVGFLAFKEWTAPAPFDEGYRLHRGLAPYEPGRFYLRELPCLRPTVDELRRRHPITTIVVDGYVDLSPGRPGLGRHLYEAFEGGVEVVGVAKNAFSSGAAVEVLRGQSERPLYVTATFDPARAADGVRAMAGPHRLPQLLRRVDQLARGAPAGS